MPIPQLCLEGKEGDEWGSEVDKPRPPARSSISLIECAMPTKPLSLSLRLALVCIALIQSGLSSLQAAPVAAAYTLSQFENCVIFHEPSSGEELCRVPVAREPIGAVPTLDLKHLVVANHLPAGRADASHVAAVLSLVDVDRGESRGSCT